MGMYVSVYRQAAGFDGTNKGLSSQVTEFCLTNVEGPFSPRENAPAAKLVMKDHGPRIGKVLQIVPEAVESRWTMFGGNFAFTSDSRFAEACERLLGERYYGAVKIFDRVEG